MRSKSWRLVLLPMLMLILPAIGWSQASLELSVNVAPPELPVYDQPPIPGDGYIWNPGYWAWGDDIQDYYWVPGTWVEAPQPDYLWTPGYWAVAGAVFLWHVGYWGPHVGFYGGVNYGYGYGGSGYEGGYWQGGHMYYNRSVTNISNTNITNVYNKTVINNVTVNRVSYNGGGGVRAQPTSAELAAAHDQHITATPVQRQHEQAARSNPELRVSENNGHPSIAATARPGALSGAGVVPARGAGTMSVVHANPEARAPQPDNRPSERRDIQPSHEMAPRQPAVRQEIQPRPQERSTESRPEVEQRRQPAQTQQRPAMPETAQRPPPPEQRQAPPQQRQAPPEQRQAPRPEPHPAAQPPRPAERPDEHEHH